MRKILFLLSHLSDTDLTWIMDSGEKQTISAGTVLIQKGEPIDSLYIVLDGTVEIPGVGGGGQPLRLGCGEVLGEVSMLDPRPPMATVVAHSDVIVLALPLELLEEKIQSDETFSAHFYRSLAVLLAHRLRKTAQLLGYGGNEPIDENEEYEDELNPEMLDTMHLMGNRFDRALQKKLAE